MIDHYMRVTNLYTALLIMHKAGWVHRDISTGNLYLYTDPVSNVKRGLIGDFEYAKKVGLDGKRDGRTVCNFLSYKLPIIF